MITWFLFDLGNTVIKLAYERVLGNICKKASIDRDALVELLEAAGGYRDMERGATTFAEFHQFLCDRAGYRGSLKELEALWANFFDGTMPGIEDVLEKVRARYRVAFLSNSNEVHAEVIPKQFGSLFEEDDRMIFSHRYKLAKPDPDLFHRALELLGTQAEHVVFVDDLIENVIAARAVGMKAFQFRNSAGLLKDLRAEGLL